MDLIQQVGALAGLAAFIGLAVLALLYFAQARDVRRLRETASFLVEGPAQTPTQPTPAPPVAATEQITQPAAQLQSAPPESERTITAPVADTDAEAFRRAELARQSEERRRRFEQRRSPSGGGGWGSRLPGGPVVTLGAILLTVGAVFGGTRLLDSSPTATPPGPSAPAKVIVAVLNSTPETGLAGEFARVIKQRGYDLGAITNTDTPLARSLVMYEPGREEAARDIAEILQINDVEAIDAEIRRASKGSSVAVILGEDNATGP